jgi:serine/threonine-protein kinase
MLQIGDQFDHFQIRAHIAQGGMSDIYRAYDFLNGQEVVLKIPNRASIGDPAQYERFQRELEVMRTLDHPAIQKGVDSGQFNNTPYLVTRLVTGESMRALVTRRAPMPVDEAVTLVRKIAEGLAHCHDHGIVHRDIKPENILITLEGEPVILDFGLALTKGAFRVTYANLSGAAGTPDYMAPEQIEGQRGDKRTDIYAVGTMLFELLAGHIPF